MSERRERPRTRAKTRTSGVRQGGSADEPGVEGRTQPEPQDEARSDLANQKSIGTARRGGSHSGAIGKQVGGKTIEE